MPEATLKVLEDPPIETVTDVAASTAVMTFTVSVVHCVAEMPELG
jgi:hypothetical protein